jgi:hypothetical protein
MGWYSYLTTKPDDNYTAYVKRKQSINYTFTNELDALFSYDDLDKLFKVGKGHRYLPPILNARMCDLISAETFVILDKFIDFSSSIDHDLKDNSFLWDKYNKPAQKLHPFLSYDRNKMKLILKEKINEYRLPSERPEASRAPQKKALRYKQAKDIAHTIYPGHPEWEEEWPRDMPTPEKLVRVGCARILEGR